MPWFCAHIVQSFRYREGEQASFPVYENIHLIEAATADEAWTKANAIVARSNEYDDRTQTLSGRPARSIYEGVRKITSVCHETRAGALISGDELTYSGFTFHSANDIKAFVKGESVKVDYDE